MFKQFYFILAEIERFLFMGLTNSGWFDWRRRSQSRSLLHPKHSWCSSNSSRCNHRPPSCVSFSSFSLPPLVIFSKRKTLITLFCFPQFTKTSAYIQITGFIENTAIGLDPADSGGELDPHGADLQGNPLGGVVYSNGTTDSTDGGLVQALNWNL